MNKKELNYLKYNPKLVEKIIKIHFPNSSIISSKRIKRGIMNLVIDVKMNNPKQEVILKLSNIYKKYGIEKEKDMFDLLRKKVDVPVPVSYGYDFSRKKFPFEYIILSKLDGSVLEDIWDKLNKKQQENLAYEMGRNLAKINSIKFKKFGTIHTSKRTRYYKSFYDMVYHDIKFSIKKIRKEEFISENLLEEIDRFFNKKLILLKKIKKPCLVHNDFHFWHIIIDKDKKNKFYINGILDWGFAEKGYKSQDFIKPARWIFNRGENIKKKFMKGYREIESFNKDDEKILKILKVYYDLVFSHRLFKTGNKKLSQEYINLVKSAIK